MSYTNKNQKKLTHKFLDMNYENALTKRESLLILEGKSLIKSQEWIINHIIILPQDEEHLLIYTGHVSGHFPNWIATGFDHDFIYKKSGIYFLNNGKQMDDKLTLYATLYNKMKNLEINYKCELLYNLVVMGELVIQDNVNSLLQHP
jgi:hypothetical protein